MQKILIADDDARIRRVIKEIVAGRAALVYEVGDGGEAIAVCAAERPDWVLMDVRMKPIDGLRATAAIKAQFPEMRIAIVTQYDDAELRAEAARAGACAYVLKENLHELPEILTGAVPGERVATSNAGQGSSSLNTSLPAAPQERGGRPTLNQTKT